MAALDSTPKSQYFTVLVVIMSIHNCPGIRLADTFLLALVILPEVLLWETAEIMVGTPTLTRWFTHPTTNKTPSVTFPHGFVL